MKKEDFSDQAIKEKLKSIYKKSFLYRPKYNGAKVDIDMTPKKEYKGNNKLIPPGKGYELDNKLIIPPRYKSIPILTKKRKVQTSDGYLLT